MKALTGIDFYIQGMTDPEARQRIKEREEIVSRILSPEQMKSREQLAMSAQKQKGQLKLWM